MKQTINLLPPKPKKIRNGLSFYSLLSVIAFMIIVSGATSGYFWWETNSLHKLITLQKGVNSTLLIRVDELSNVVANRRLPSAREGMAFELQQEIEAMSQMLEITDEYITKNHKGYLNVINALQKYLPDTASLESYKLYRDGKLSFIKGNAENPAAIPIYIEILRNRGFLWKQNISNIRSLRDVDQYTFELTFSAREIEQ